VDGSTNITNSVTFVQNNILYLYDNITWKLYVKKLKLIVGSMYYKVVET